MTVSCINTTPLHSPTGKARGTLPFGFFRQRGKLQALHSSAALVVNFFEYWRTRSVQAVAEACGAPRDSYKMNFEVKHANALGRIPSHLDVVFTGTPESKPLAIESKFTECYQRHTRRSLARGYLSKPGLWRELPGCETLAQRLREEEGQITSFAYLDAPQLLKHTLGLATTYPTGFTLLYLWYGIKSPEASQHWKEIIEFESYVKDEIDFRVMTYQELFSRVAGLKGIDRNYIQYLKTRYFTEKYNSFLDEMLAAEDKYGVSVSKSLMGPEPRARKKLGRP